MADTDLHTPEPSSSAAPSGDDNREVRHEQSDVNVRGILWFIAVLIVSAVVIQIAVWGLFEMFARRAQRADRTPPPLAVGELEVPPEPRLQGMPWSREWMPPQQELTTYRAAQMQRLQSYGWVDRSAGVAHIPIERAMEIVAEQGKR